MRVVGASDQVLQFDNMSGRATKGTTEWEHYSVVLDVPPESASMNYGVFVNGGGQMWVSGLKIEPVSNEVVNTNKTQQSLPAGPRNIEFSTE